MQSPWHTFLVGGYSPILNAINALGGQVIGSGPSVTGSFSQSLSLNGGFDTSGSSDWISTSIPAPWGVQSGTSTEGWLARPLVTTPGAFLHTHILDQ
jgi:hypothetical protein